MSGKQQIEGADVERNKYSGFENEYGKILISLGMSEKERVAFYDLQIKEVDSFDEAYKRFLSAQKFVKRGEEIRERAFRLALLYYTHFSWKNSQFYFGSDGRTKLNYKDIANIILNGSKEEVKKLFTMSSKEGDKIVLNKNSILFHIGGNKRALILFDEMAKHRDILNEFGINLEEVKNEYREVKSKVSGLLFEIYIQLKEQGLIKKEFTKEELWDIFTGKDEYTEDRFEREEMCKMNGVCSLTASLLAGEENENKIIADYFRKIIKYHVIYEYNLVRESGNNPNAVNRHIGKAMRRDSNIAKIVVETTKKEAEKYGFSSTRIDGEKLSTQMESLGKEIENNRELFEEFKDSCEDENVLKRAVEKALILIGGVLKEINKQIEYEANELKNQREKEMTKAKSYQEEQQKQLEQQRNKREEERKREEEQWGHYDKEAASEERGKSNK